MVISLQEVYVGMKLLPSIVREGRPDRVRIQRGQNRHRRILHSINDRTSEAVTCGKGCCRLFHGERQVMKGGEVLKTTRSFYSPGGDPTCLTAFGNPDVPCFQAACTTLVPNTVTGKRIPGPES